MSGDWGVKFRISSSIDSISISNLGVDCLCICICVFNFICIYIAAEEMVAACVVPWLSLQLGQTQTQEARTYSHIHPAQKKQIILFCTFEYIIVHTYSYTSKFKYTRRELTLIYRVGDLTYSVPMNTNS